MGGNGAFPDKHLASPMDTNGETSGELGCPLSYDSYRRSSILTWSWLIPVRPLFCPTRTDGLSHPLLLSKILRTAF